LGTFASALKRERPNSGGMMHTCSAGCGPSSFTKRNGRAFFTVISCIGGLTLDKLPAPPTVGGAFGIAVTGRGSMWRTRIHGSLPSGLHPTTSGALRTLQQKSRTSLVWRFESTIQRAGCVARKSGSVRGAAGQPARTTHAPCRSRHLDEVQTGSSVTRRSGCHENA
jgi:hypothetical protein